MFDLGRYQTALGEEEIIGNKTLLEVRQKVRVLRRIFCNFEFRKAGHFEHKLVDYVARVAFLAEWETATSSEYNMMRAVGVT